MNLSIRKVMLVDDKGYEFSTQEMIRFTPNFTFKRYFLILKFHDKFLCI